MGRFLLCGVLMSSYNLIFSKDKNVVYIFDAVVSSTFMSLFLIVILMGIVGFLPLGIASAVFTFGAIFWGIPLGFVLSLPCIVILYFAYKIFIKKKILSVVPWILISLATALIYTSAIYQFFPDFPPRNLIIYFCIPVSVLAGFMSWKKIVVKNPAMNKVRKHEVKL